MVKKKSKSLKKNSGKKAPLRSKKSQKKAIKKPKAIKKRKAEARKTAQKKRSTPYSSTPRASIMQAQKAANSEDILEKYRKESGYSFSKPESLAEFDKHLEETAKIVSSEGKLKDKELPHFSDDHIKHAEKKENTEKIIDDSIFDQKPVGSSMADQLKKPETPDPNHETLKAEHSHPYTENKGAGSSFDTEQHLPRHHKHAINSIVLAIVGVVVPIVSIVGLVLAIHSVKKGSHTGKGAILLSIATFIINITLIYIFLMLFFSP